MVDISVPEKIKTAVWLCYQVWVCIIGLCIKAYIGICIYRNFQAQYPLNSEWTRTCRCTLPVHCHSRGSTQPLFFTEKAMLIIEVTN